VRRLNFSGATAYGFKPRNEDRTAGASARMPFGFITDSAFGFAGIPKVPLPYVH